MFDWAFGTIFIVERATENGLFCRKSYRKCFLHYAFDRNECVQIFTGKPQITMPDIWMVETTQCNLFSTLLWIKEYSIAMPSFALSVCVCSVLISEYQIVACTCVWLCFEYGVATITYCICLLCMSFSWIISNRCVFWIQI